MLAGVILPALALGLAGWILPRLLARVFPEGVRPLVWLALTAALLMILLSMALFLGLYRIEGAPPDALARAGWAALVWHLLRLALASALIWGPILALSVAGLPGRWKTARW
ncbi:hypothetical protein [Limimaricola pyoseonensis]|uniref:Uncharacterized protein n=1 Tax=Limimaricola pyoseonensis TaxID=521013 RepID=A0A1G7C1P7_9RHOB|nr:hypothetical protein [Limimaricola pyoseonensis]SDE33252.1 hypothetical protein SAMN04488567_1321 [Limimaricola pyoseonensis]